MLDLADKQIVVTGGTVIHIAAAYYRSRRCQEARIEGGQLWAVAAPFLLRGESSDVAEELVQQARRLLAAGHANLRGPEPGLRYLSGRMRLHTKSVLDVTVKNCPADAQVVSC